MQPARGVLSDRCPIPSPIRLLCVNHGNDFRGEQEGGPRPGRKGGKRGGRGKKRPDDDEDTSDEDSGEEDHSDDCVSAVTRTKSEKKLDVVLL